MCWISFQAFIKFNIILNEMQQFGSIYVWSRYIVAERRSKKRSSGGVAAVTMYRDHTASRFNDRPPFSNPYASFF